MKIQLFKAGVMVAEVHSVKEYLAGLNCLSMTGGFIITTLVGTLTQEEHKQLVECAGPDH